MNFHPNIASKIRILAACALGSNSNYAYYCRDTRKDLKDSEREFLAWFDSVFTADRCGAEALDKASEVIDCYICDTRQAAYEGGIRDGAWLMLELLQVPVGKAV